MPDLKIQQVVVLTLQASELRLIGLALAGKLLDIDRRPAKELNAKIMSLRGQQMKSMTSVADGATRRAKEALDEEPEESTGEEEISNVWSNNSEER